MKIAIIGVGAMGGIYAALFADAGHEVWCIDLWREHLDAIREKGLAVSGASGERVVHSIQVAENIAEAGDPCDLVVIATKAAGVAGAAQSLRGHLRDDTMVLTIQNGLGAEERIAEHLPRETLLLGVAQGFGASVPAPGQIHHNAMALIRLGEPDGGISGRLEGLVTLWQEAGFNVQAFADINQLIWEKFVCNVTFSGPCTVFDRTLGEVMADPDAWEIAQSCGLEAFAVGRAKGINFSFDDAAAYVTAFGKKMPDARPSMLLDHHAGRRSEIDAINGIVSVLGQDLGVATPYNDVVSAIVRAKESAF